MHYHWFAKFTATLIMLMNKFIERSYLVRLIFPEKSLELYLFRATDRRDGSDVDYTDDEMLLNHIKSVLSAFIRRPLFLLAGRNVYSHFLTILLHVHGAALNKQ